MGTKNIDKKQVANRQKTRKKGKVTWSLCCRGNQEERRHTSYIISLSFVITLFSFLKIVFYEMYTGYSTKTSSIYIFGGKISLEFLNLLRGSLFPFPPHCFRIKKSFSDHAQFFTSWVPYKVTSAKKNRPPLFQAYFLRQLLRGCTFFSFVALFLGGGIGQPKYSLQSPMFKVSCLSSSSFHCPSLSSRVFPSLPLLY